MVDDQPRSSPPESGAQAPRSAPGGPIFLENPDGTITEAVPSNYRQSRRKFGHRSRSGSRPGGRQDGDSDASSGSNLENTALSLSQEMDFLYSRHERVLQLLLLAQLALEGLYDFVYVVRMRDGSAVREFQTMYGWHVSQQKAEWLFWTIFTFQLSYCIVYYVIAVLAICGKRPRFYRLFANFSVFGIVGLVLLAYVDKFNLIIFFLHLLVYIYARFLQGLTASLLLLPPAAAV